MTRCPCGLLPLEDCLCDDDYREAEQQRTDAPFAAGIAAMDRAYQDLVRSLTVPPPTGDWWP